jgi:hypothetical protein
MPRLVHRQVTTIQIVSVEVTWTEEQADAFSSGKRPANVQRRRKSMREVKNTQDEGPPIVKVPQTEEESRPLQQISADDTTSSDF